MRFRRASLVLLALAFLTPQTSARAGAAVAWRDWSRATFEEARATKRLVLLDVTAGWCHWCRVMADESYADSSVVAEINANFIPIRVDFDLRPDIGDRYLTNGWPTTAVLSANGHLLLSKTYLPSKEFREFLQQAVKFYRLNHTQVDRKVAEAGKIIDRTWAPDSLLPPTLTEDEYIEQNLRALVDTEDKEHGGFGASPKTPRWDAISFLLRAADAQRDDDLRALAVRATAAALALQDSVDGGFFRAALQPDWKKIRYERLLNDQALALATLTRVARATGEERFKTAAARVDGFARKFLTVSGQSALIDRTAYLDRLGWIHAVAADARQRGATWLDGDVYFRLSRTARQRTAMMAPVAIFTTDAAARMWSAELARARATGAPMPDLAWPETLASLMAGTNGAYYHAAWSDRRSGPGFLADQAAVGHALLDAYQGGRQMAALARAEALATWMQANLEDRDAGGFRYAPRDTAAIGRLRAGDKPEAANVEAATFFLRLYWLTGKESYRDVARRADVYLRSGDKITLDPARAELTLRLRQEPVRLLVIGTKEKAAITRTLAAAALGAPVPDVVVRYLDGPPAAGGAVAWPNGPPSDAKAPAIYRWTSTGWRGPVTNPANLASILDKPPTQP